MSPAGARLNVVPDTPTRAVAYIRVSKERDGMISPELQLAAIEQHCERHRYVIVEAISDLDLTGRFWKRRQVEKAIGLIEAGQADVLVVWKVSRVSRNRKDWAIAVDRVEGVGGRMESATEPMDTTTSSGRFARGMLAELAAFESERIGEQWKETHERRVRQGKPANGKPRYGYQYSKEEGFTPDPVTGPILADLYRRYLSGQSVYSLVQFLNEGPSRPVSGYGVSGDGLWSTRTVRRILDQGFGAGYITRHGELAPGIHPPVITPGEWTEYQSRRETRRVNRRTERSPYLLSGLVRCACKSPMNAGLFGADRKPKYRCKASSEKRAHTGGYVMASYLERAVLDWLEGVAHAVNVESRSAEAEVPVAKPVDKIANLKKEFLQLDQRLDKATNKMLDETIPEDAYARLRDEIEVQKANIQTALRAAKVTAAKPPAQLAASLLEDWPLLAVDGRRDILSRLIKYVEVKPGRPRAEITIHRTW